MTEFQKSILEALIQVHNFNREHGAQGATPLQVFERMRSNGDVTPEITLTTVSEEIISMAQKGWLGEDSQRCALGETEGEPTQTNYTPNYN